MFGLFKKKPPVLSFKLVRVFGKLPGFPDFVRYRSADPEAVQLDSWVSEGQTALMREGLQSSLESEWTLNLCKQQGPVYSIATVLSSQDKSGRHYPLVITAEVENAWLLDYKPSFPLLFKALRNLGEALQSESVASQPSLIQMITQFEKQSWVLNKSLLLEDRISALKKINQEQAWGSWCKKAPGLNPASWKIEQVQNLSQPGGVELPLGSNDPEIETCYWLQLMDDLKGLKQSALSYCALASVNTKKLIIQTQGGGYPPFLRLFQPCTLHPRSGIMQTQAVYQGQMSLLEASSYWGKMET